MTTLLSCSLESNNIVQYELLILVILQVCDILTEVKVGISLLRVAFTALSSKYVF